MARHPTIFVNIAGTPMARTRLSVVLTSLASKPFSEVKSGDRYIKTIGSGLLGRSFLIEGVFCRIEVLANLCAGNVLLFFHEIKPAFNAFSTFRDQDVC